MPEPRKEHGSETGSRLPESSTPIPLSWPSSADQFHVCLNGEPTLLVILNNSEWESMSDPRPEPFRSARNDKILIVLPDPTASALHSCPCP